MNFTMLMKSEAAGTEMSARQPGPEISKVVSKKKSLKKYQTKKS
jgi:hypothetical protein